MPIAAAVTAVRALSLVVMTVPLVIPLTQVSNTAPAAPAPAMTSGMPTVKTDESATVHELVLTSAVP